MPMGYSASIFTVELLKPDTLTDNHTPINPPTLSNTGPTKLNWFSLAILLFFIYRSLQTDITGVKNVHEVNLQQWIKNSLHFHLSVNLLWVHADFRGRGFYKIIMWSCPQQVLERFQKRHVQRLFFVHCNTASNTSTKFNVQC